MNGQSPPGEGRLDQQGTCIPPRDAWGYWSEGLVGASLCYRPPSLPWNLSPNIWQMHLGLITLQRQHVHCAPPNGILCVLHLFVFAIFKPQKYALGRKRGKWWYLGGREEIKIISQSCSPLCRILAHKERGARSLHQGPQQVTVLQFIWE